MALAETVNTKVISSVKTKSNYKSLAFINTTSQLLTDAVYDALKQRFNEQTGRNPPDSVFKEGDETLCVIIHDPSEVLDEAIKDFLDYFSKQGTDSLPPGTNGSIKYSKLVSYVKEPFNRTLPVNKSFLLHVYKK